MIKAGAWQVCAGRQTRTRSAQEGIRALCWDMLVLWTEAFGSVCLYSWLVCGQG